MASSFHLIFSTSPSSLPDDSFVDQTVTISIRNVNEWTVLEQKCIYQFGFREESKLSMEDETPFFSNKPYSLCWWK